MNSVEQHGVRVRQVVFFRSGRARVYAEANPGFIVSSPDLVSRYSIRSGEYCPSSAWKKFLEESSYFYATDYSLRVLARAPITAARIKQKLRRRKFCSVTINKVLNRLHELGLLDDRVLIRSEIERLEKKNYSQPEIESRLFQKGFSRDLVEESLSNHPTDEISKIKKLLGKPTLAQKSPRKKVQFLLRKGFSYSDISTVLEEDSL